MASYTIGANFEGGKGLSAAWVYPVSSQTTTGTGHTSSNPLELEIGDTLTIEIGSSSGPGTAVISGFSIFTDNSDATVGASSSITRTVASGGTTADTLTITKTSTTSSTSDDFFLERQALNNTPIISSVGITGGATSNMTATVNLSYSGVTGTLEYAQTTTNSLPSTGWQTSNQFTHPRPPAAGPAPSTRYYWASRNRNTDSFSAGFQRDVGYFTGDPSVDAPSLSPTSPIASDYTGNVAATITGGSTNTRYRVLNTTINAGCGNTGDGNGTIQIGAVSSTHLPSAGQTHSYKVQYKVLESKGGNDLWADVVPARTFTIERSTAQDTTPDNFVDFTDRTGAAPNTTQTSTSQTITGITGSVNVSVSGDGSPSVSINGGSFTSSPGTISNGQTIQARLTSSATAGATNTADITIGTVTKEFRVTTASSGGSGSGVGSSSANYGIEIYDTNGTTTVLSPTTRYITVLNDGTSVTIPAKVNGVNGSTLLSIDMTGLTTSNSDVTFTEVLGNFVVEVVRVTTGSNQGFRLENTSSSAITVTPLVLRY